MASVARTANTPQQQRSVETRSKIVHAAAATIVEFGYAGATLARIRQNSGVTNGAFYHHFATREAVAEAVLDEYKVRADQATSAAVAAAGSGMEAFLRLSVTLAELLRSDIVVLAGVTVTTEVGSQFLSRGAYVDWLVRVEPILQLCQREGTIQAELDAHDVSALLVSTFTGTQLLSGALTKRADVVERVGRHWRLLLPGLVPPGEAAAVLALLDTVFSSEVVTDAVRR